MATFRPSGIKIAIRQSLSEGSARTGTTLDIDPIITKDGHRVTMADMGDIMVGKIDEGTDSEEIITFTGITDNTTYYTLTGVVWGYNFYNTTGDVDANKKRHDSGAEFIITNDDHFLALQYPNKDNDLTIGGTWTFTDPNLPKVDTYNTPTSDEQFATKKYVDDTATGTTNVDKLVSKATAGETVSAGQVVYFDETAKEWLLADASATGTSENVLLGIARGSGTDGNLISGGVLLYGLDGNQNGFTAGDIIYLSDTAGTLASSAGTKEVIVGYAHSATEIFFAPTNFKDNPTSDEKAALAGTSGQSPDTNNKYIDDKDTDIAGASITASTIAFLESTPDTITDTGDGFITAGFRKGQSITVSGSASNDGTYTIDSVVAGTITLISTDSLTAESLGASVTITSDSSNKVVRYDSNGDVIVPTTPTAGDAATSKTYVDTAISGITTDKFVGAGDTSNKTYFNTQIPMMADNFTATGWTGTTVYGPTYFSGTSSAASSIISNNAIYYFMDSGPVNVRNLQFSNASGKVIVEFTAGFDLEGTGETDAVIGLSNAVYTSYNASTADSVAFTINSLTNLYANVSDAGSASTTEQITGITVGEMNLYRIEFGPGVDAKFYVNGALKKTITTNLPNGSNEIKLLVAVSNSSSTHSIACSAFNISIEL